MAHSALPTTSPAKAAMGTDNPPVKDTLTVQQLENAAKAAQHGTGPYLESGSSGEGEGTVGGHGVEFSTLSIIGLAYAILNSWTAMAASLSVALPSGGTTAVLWGIVVACIGNLGTAASLAEICHVYTTSGGQYHFAFILSPPSWAPLMSWMSGWISVAGWWALTATASSLAGSLITGQISLMYPDYNVERWHIFLIYLVWSLAAMAVNIWGIRLLPAINRIALFWSLMGAATIAITCLATASGRYESAGFVFGTYINDTGFNDGAAWMLGLLQASFGLTGFDAVSHMVEEMPRPHINAPRAMVLAVLLGSSTSFVFLTMLLFCINNVDDVITSSAGPLLACIYQATNSVPASVALQVFPVVSMAFAAQGILTASSRMTYAFARDGGLPFSPFFAKMERSGVPNNAVYLTTSLVIAFGLIYLGSSSALNAILSSSVVFLNISYSIPIILLLFRGRQLLRPHSFPEPTLSLGPIWGPVCNIVGLAFTAVTTVFFLFPPALPTTADSMNYAIVVFGIIFIVASLQWIFVGHKTFAGPRNLGGLLELARSEIGLDGRGRIINTEAVVVPTLEISEKEQVAAVGEEGVQEKME